MDSSHRLNAHGAFRVLHLIGEGVLGPVYRTYDPSRDRLVALKILRMPEVSPEQRTRLVEGLSELVDGPTSHGRLVKYLAAGIVEGTPHLLMEYVSGESLAVRLRRGERLDQDEILEVLANVAEALDHAAEEGLLHGRLNPADVLFTDDSVRLTGFGVAQTLFRLGLHPPVNETYVAPDREETDPVSRADDVFGLAAVAYELLSGFPPGDEVVDAARAAGRPLDRPVETVLLRAMATRPAERYQTARLFVDALAATVGSMAQVVPSAASKVVEDSILETEQELEAILDRYPLHGSTGEERVDEGSPPDLQLGGVQVTYEADVLQKDQDLTTLFPTESDRTEHQLAFDELEQPRPAEAVVPQVESQPPVETVRLPTPVPEPVGFPEREPTDEWTADRFDEPISVLEEADKPSRTRTLWVAGALLIASVAVGYTLGLLGGSDETTQPVTTPEPGSAPTSRPETEVRVEPPRKTAPQVTPPVQKPAPKPVPPANPTRSTGGPAAVRPFESLRAVPSPVEGRPAPDAGRYGRSSTTARKPEVPTKTPAAVPASVLAKTGSLFVESRPAGSRVFLDNRPAGTTPLQIPEVSVGQRTIRIERDGYRPWTTTVTIVGGRRERVAGSLTPGSGS